MRVAAAGFAAFLGWAFQGVGPSADAKATISAAPPVKAPGLGLLFGGEEPKVAIYCGVPAGIDSFRTAQEVFDEMGI